jgi:hypothetical protein
MGREHDPVKRKDGITVQDGTLDGACRVHTESMSFAAEDRRFEGHPHTAGLPETKC